MTSLRVVLMEAFKNNPEQLLDAINRYNRGEIVTYDEIISGQHYRVAIQKDEGINYIKVDEK